MAQTILVASSIGVAQSTTFPGPDRELINAIIQGDHGRAMRLIEAEPGAAKRPLGAPPSAGGNGLDFRDSALSIAVRNHRMKIARLLLEAGADPNGRSAAGGALMELVQLPAMVDLLVEFGADMQGEKQAFASLDGRLDTRPRHQALARSLMGHGMTCTLEDAVRLGFVARVRKILNGPDAPSRVPVALLYYASDARSDDLAFALIRGGCSVEGDRPPAKCSNWGYPESALQYALFEGRPHTALALLDAGASLRGWRDGWDTPPGLRLADSRAWRAENGDMLDRAIDLGSLELFERLSAGRSEPGPGLGGIPVEALIESHLGQDRLADRMIRAAWRGHGAILERLVDRAMACDAPVDYPDVLLASAAAGHAHVYRDVSKLTGAVSVHALSLAGDLEELGALLDQKPEALDLPDPRCGVSPLGWAVMHRRSGVVDLLLAHGARSDVEVDGRVSRARWEGRGGTTAPRLSEGGQRVSLLEVAIKNRTYEIAASILRSGVSLDPRGLNSLCRHHSSRALQLIEEAFALDRIDKSSPDWAARALLTLAIPNHAAADEGKWWSVLMVAGAGDCVGKGPGMSLVDQAYGRGASLRDLTRLERLGSQLSRPVAVALGRVDEQESRRWVASLGEREWEQLLSTAAWRASAASYQRLLAAKANVSAEAALKQVHRLAGRGRLDLIRLVALRVPGGYRFDEDPEVLQRGAGHPPLVAELLRKGAAPHPGPSSNEGPLQRAAQECSVESVRLLIQAGADPRERSRRGRTPLHQVRRFLDRMDVVRALEGPYAEDPEKRALAVIGMLLAAGADPLSVDDGGQFAFERIRWAAWSPSGAARLRALLAQYMDESWL